MSGPLLSSHTRALTRTPARINRAHYIHYIVNKCTPHQPLVPVITGLNIKELSTDFPLEPMNCRKTCNHTFMSSREYGRAQLKNTVLRCIIAAPFRSNWGSCWGNILCFFFIFLFCKHLGFISSETKYLLSVVFIISTNEK